MKPNGTARVRVTNRFTNQLFSERDEPCRITPKRVATKDHKFDRATLHCIDSYASRSTYRYELLSFEIERSISNTHPKLTRNANAILERLQQKPDHMLLELQITSSGGSSYDDLNELRRAGLVEMIDHPTVIDRQWNEPARAVRLVTQTEEAA